MPKRYNNTIHKLFFKIIKIILSNITRIKPIKYIEDPKETPSTNHAYIKENTIVEEITIVDIITTTHPVKSNAISIINLNTS